MLYVKQTGQSLAYCAVSVSNLTQRLPGEIANEYNVRLHEK